MSSSRSFLSLLGNLAGQVIRSVVSNRTSSPSGPTRQPTTPRSSGTTTAPKPKPTSGAKRPSGGTASESGDLIAAHAAELAARERLLEGDPTPGQLGATATIEVPPPAANALTVTYAPEKDGDPDAGEVVWTWIPYEEADGRGKDRPVLVIARHGRDRVYVVRLTSKSHDGDRDYLSIGSGAWDSKGRESWVDIDQIYSVHVEGMRREAAVLDRTRFDTVAAALKRAHGWSAA
ncbi:type II toxin-antitoxin system PemK/MazF family toxin [Microbacterium gorillae]|uniref:type II toxin-antitoxin system PemK/MazF family toxin n=1 Tax=Microbacterium gorillae TaxID=1231063 RepID=UPI000A53B33B|nr:type II toxin-antitoxin system PemK/MazF family toxin [Microbacterium gorillae]